MPSLHLPKETDPRAINLEPTMDKPSEALGVIGAAESDVGRQVYRRIERLMDAASAQSPEGLELRYLSALVEAVEEYGFDACDGEPSPHQDGTLFSDLAAENARLRDAVDKLTESIKAIAQVAIKQADTQPNGWRPIDSAPKIASVRESAKPFLGWCPHDDPDESAIRVCWWEPQIRGGIWYGDRDLPEHPTHWMPLPPSPTGEDGHG